MTDPARHTDDSDEVVVHPVRWMGSAFDRIAQAADALTAREHRKHTAADIIRIGTLRFVDEILDHLKAS